MSLCLRISSFRAHHSQLKKPADVCRSVLACRRLRQYNTFVKERDRLYTHRTEHTRTHSSKLSVFSVCLCVADLSVRLVIAAVYALTTYVEMIWCVRVCVFLVWVRACSPLLRCVRCVDDDGWLTRMTRELSSLSLARSKFRIKVAR